MTTTDNNVSTSNVWPNYNVNNVKTASAKDTKTMGKDQFLKILITQLQKSGIRCSLWRIKNLSLKWPSFPR